MSDTAEIRGIQKNGPNIASVTPSSNNSEVNKLPSMSTSGNIMESQNVGNGTNDQKLKKANDTNENITKDKNVVSGFRESGERLSVHVTNPFGIPTNTLLRYVAYLTIAIAVVLFLIFYISKKEGARSKDYLNKVCKIDSDCIYEKPVDRLECDPQEKRCKRTPASGCVLDVDCADGYVCKEDNGNKICLSNKGGRGGVLNPPKEDGTCDSPLIVSGSDQVCRYPKDSNGCKATTECSIGSCVSGKCSSLKIGDACGSDPKVLNSCGNESLHCSVKNLPSGTKGGYCQYKGIENTEIYAECSLAANKKCVEDTECTGGIIGGENFCLQKSGRFRSKCITDESCSAPYKCIGNICDIANNMPSTCDKSEECYLQDCSDGKCVTIPGFPCLVDNKPDKSLCYSNICNTTQSSMSYYANNTLELWTEFSKNLQWDVNFLNKVSGTTLGTALVSLDDILGGYYYVGADDHGKSKNPENIKILPTVLYPTQIDLSQLLSGNFNQHFGDFCIAVYSENGVNWPTCLYYLARLAGHLVSYTLKLEYGTKYEEHTPLDGDEYTIMGGLSQPVNAGGGGITFSVYGIIGRSASGLNAIVTTTGFVVKANSSGKVTLETKTTWNAYRYIGIEKDLENKPVTSQCLFGEDVYQIRLHYLLGDNVRATLLKGSLPTMLVDAATEKLVSDRKITSNFRFVILTKVISGQSTHAERAEPYLLLYHGGSLTIIPYTGNESDVKVTSISEIKRFLPMSTSYTYYNDDPDWDFTYPNYALSYKSSISRGSDPYYCIMVYGTKKVEKQDITGLFLITLPQGDNSTFYDPIYLPGNFRLEDITGGGCSILPVVFSKNVCSKPKN